MEFKTLKEVSIQELAGTFNEAFSDYLVPLQLTKEQLQNKLIADGIKPEHSAGAFQDEKLIGFILHGIGAYNNRLTAYNGGTGVIPDFRGNRITSQLYEFILPELRKKGIEQSVLEVITTNHKALKVYETIGFKTERELICFKAENINTAGSLSDSFKFIEPRKINYEELSKFSDWTPTWQNSWESIKRSENNLKLIQLEKNSNVVGYLIFNPENARIINFSIKQPYRRQGLMKFLFSEVSKRVENKMSLLNIDARATETINFLSGVGFKESIRQYEMMLKLN
ncbi:GNAT family N-acetyltransferase [Gramella sp. BOM4]|nr:GNAT family N-acetyltransferase [Christiangramia bathymodioli]